jgi:hypothetical protein
VQSLKWKKNFFYFFEPGLNNECLLGVSINLVGVKDLRRNTKLSLKTKKEHFLMHFCSTDKWQLWCQRCSPSSSSDHISASQQKINVFTRKDVKMKFKLEWSFSFWTRSSQDIVWMQKHSSFFSSWGLLRTKVSEEFPLLFIFHLVAILSDTKVK